MWGGPRGPPLLDEQERPPARTKVARTRHVLPGFQGSTATEVAAVRADGVEPSFAASETAVLPLDEARKYSVGLEGNDPSPSA